MAAGGDVSPFPLLVRVSESCSGLKRKLQIYFQSPRKSGGGECTVKAGPTKDTFWVEFLERKARQRVLEKESHELELPDQKLKLTVRLPTAKDEDEDNKEEISMEESKLKDAAQEQDASEQYTKFPPETGSTDKEVSKFSGNIPSLVAFQNILTDQDVCFLILLVENISRLSKTEEDFEVEFIPEVETAVVTFLKHIDTRKFVDHCSQNQIIQKKKISVLPVEETRSILVENLPAYADESCITLFFENPKNGGGPITKTECFSKDNSVLIHFSECKVVKAILTRKLLFNNSPISMFPYYPTLGTALYGKARPPVKLPKPLMVPIDPYLLKFFQKNDQEIGEINSTMESSHCALTWPEPNYKEPQIMLSPSATLIKQRTQSNIIKMWSEDVSTRFSCLMSNYKVRKYNVDSVVWEAIRDSIENESILTEFDNLQKVVIRAGKLEDIQRTEPQIMTQIEKFSKKIEKEKKSIKETWTVCPGRFSILCNDGFEETLHKGYPELEVTYNALTKSISLTGLPADVYKAKSEILEKLQSLAQKSFHIAPEIIQFLQQVNCETFSQSLFADKKISATYEVEGETILLVGLFPQVLPEAEEHMRKALDFKCISKVDSGFLIDSQWERLINNLDKTYNSSSKTIIIEQQNSDAGVKITIAGCASSVWESYQEIYKFIEETTKIEELVAVDSLAVIQYMKEENEQIWNKLKEKNVEVDFKTVANQRGISLSGPKGEVTKGVAMVKQALDSIHVRYFSIDKPGAKVLFKDKEEFYVGEAKRKYKCFIQLREDGDNSSRGSTDGPNVRCKITLKSGILVTVQKGDLAQFSADVVVNAANEDLQHIGGLSAALSKAAGPELQKECDQIIQQQSKVSPGCAVVSGPGQLPYNQVIHAVGPRWNGKHAPRCVQLLKNAVTESLFLAEQHGHTSIAIPALSSGEFGFPLKMCAETIVLAVKENIQDTDDELCLKKIHFVDSSEETIKAFCTAMRTIFMDALPSNDSLCNTQSGNQKTTLRKSTENRKVLASIQTKEHLNILLIRGDIQDAETDIIVNSVPSDLQLGQGSLSEALLRKAGPELQKELKKERMGISVKPGHVFQTSGCNLDCHSVFHVVISSWNNGDSTSKKVMKDVIRKCLESATTLSLKSITFPAIGTGNLGFPKPLFAKLILSQVLKFSSSTPLKTLKEVHFLLHPSDYDNIQAFQKEFAGYTDGDTTRDRLPNTNNTEGVYEIKIGSITFQVAFGDITKEDSEVIVNSTDKTFLLKRGVSKAILKAAGLAVETECAALATQHSKSFIVTQGGNLMCKKIIHVIGGNDVKRTMSELLQECEQMKYTSISLPAIGTGQAKQDPADVAKSIIDAIEDFAQTGSGQSVKKVKVVIILPHLLNVFCDAMKKRVSSKSSSSMFSRLKGWPHQSSTTQENLVLEKVNKSVIFEVCGEYEKNIEKTISWIKDMILKDQGSYTFSDTAIKNFGEKEFKKLSELRETLAIDMSVKPRESHIAIFGLTGDVLKATQVIEDMIKNTRLRVEEEAKAEELSNTIQWKYEDKGNFKAFDKITNLHLEEAKKAKKTDTEVTIKNVKYKVDFHNNRATNKKGESLSIDCLKKSEVETPHHWDDMKNQNLLMVDLQPGDVEYNRVKDKFCQTCSNYTIEKIQRVQNRCLWNMYKARKTLMDEQNKNTDNEKFLFHGTDVDSLVHVNNQGFNRSYAGKNAVCWGKGTYFAINASYSAMDTYSKPDVNGKKYMYYVRVLTGDYTIGNSTYIVPPNKIQDSTVLYDSVTDNLHNPSLFVIFYDNQSYPEYLITFRK